MRKRENTAYYGAQAHTEGKRVTVEDDLWYIPGILPLFGTHTHTHNGLGGWSRDKKQGKLIIAPKIVPIVEGAKSNDDAAQEQGDGTGDGFFLPKNHFQGERE